ncbi:MAG: anti-phage deoxyguanosine triphosphatase [Pseudomonadota bacterium]
MLDNELWGKRRQTRGKTHDGDVRTAFQRDKARIMHAASFRRLQAKKQVVGVGINDFYRTRLTHSLEAAQIGTGIVTQLRATQPDLALALHLDEHLIEAICLAHDIGHPPFGHGGEVALHYMMHKYGGFEGNGQTFRILTKLESYTEHDGMNLARRTLLGVIKYPGFVQHLDRHRRYPGSPQKFSQLKANHWIPPKGLFIDEKPAFEWVMDIIDNKDKMTFSSTTPPTNDQRPQKTIFKSVDCSIMELADDIAYAIHDLEDAIVTQMIDKKAFSEELTNALRALKIDDLSNNADAIEDALFSSQGYQRKNAIGYLVNAFITPIRLSPQNTFEEAVLDYNACLPSEYAKALNIFKDFVFNHVILKPQMQIMNYKGQQVLMSLFEVFAHEPERLLPESTAQRWQCADSTPAKMRIIADYIAGMTDHYAHKLYADMFPPKSNGITDR